MGIKRGKGLLAVSADTGQATRVQVTDYRMFYEAVDGVPVRRMQPLEVSFAAYGAGDLTLVLLHSITGSSREFSSLIAALVKEIRLLAIDLRGFGNSHRPTGPVEISELSEDVHVVLESDLGRKRTIIYGHGLGASVAIALAAQHGGVDGLVLSGIALATGEPNVLSTLPDLALANPGGVTAWLSATAGTGVNDKDVSAQVVGQAASAWLGDEAGEQIRSLDIPILLIDGLEDPFMSTSSDTGALLSQGKGELKIVKLRAGHDMPWVEAERVAEEIRTWINQLHESNWRDNVVT